MNIMAELEHVLVEEQELLLSGDYSRLEALAARKSVLADELATATDLPEADYKDIITMSRHNEALLQSAQRGIQAAISQLREYSSGEHQSTYSKEGQRRPLSRPVSVTQKY